MVPLSTTTELRNTNTEVRSKRRSRWRTGRRNEQRTGRCPKSMVLQKTKGTEYFKKEGEVNFQMLLRL